MSWKKIDRCLYQHSTGNFYGRIHRDRRQIWRSLKTKDVTVARARLVLFAEQSSVTSWRYPIVPEPCCVVAYRSSHAPDRSGVYFVWEHGKVVYVGLSTNLNQRTRIASHTELEEDHELSWLEFPREMIGHAEAYYKGLLMPIRNGAERRYS